MQQRLLLFAWHSATLVSLCASHAILVAPTPRPGMELSPGPKLQPFNNARRTANSGCGGVDNNDPGVQTPTLAYTPGTPLIVQWEITIPHPTDVLDTGVRIAIHYDRGDSFDKAENILAGGLDGDPVSYTHLTLPTKA